MTSLALTNDETLANLALVMGIHRDPGEWTPTQEADADRIVRSGQRMFYSAHEWGFLTPILLITTNEPYTTGTIEVANGVVTLTGGTFPTWAEDAWILFGSRRYGVASRDSGTQLTLDNTDSTNDAAALTTYSLQRFQYDLPANFGGLAGDLIYDPDWSTTERRVISALWEQLRHAQSFTITTGAPRYYAVYTKTFDGTVGTEWKIMFDPVPDTIYRFRGRHRIIPDQLDGTNDFPAGDTIHAETVQSAILSAAENFYHANPTGPHTIRFQQLLARSIEYDKRVNSPHQIPRRCRNDREWREAQRSIPGVYIGLTD